MSARSDKNRIIIFDTTLRDGEQSPGASMNLDEKLRIAEVLEGMGVDVIEAGFPILLDNPASASPQLAALPDSAYHVTFDVLSANGAPAEAKSLVVASRASNGFTVRLAAAADNVVARWRVSRLNA